MLYISLGIGGALGLYALGRWIVNKKKNGGKGQTTPTDENDPTKEQEKLDPTLLEAIKKGTAKGKKVYSKVNDVNLRWNPVVNNGLSDNIFQTITDKNTYMGTIFYVYKSTDNSLINPATGQPYNWIVLDLDPTLWKKLNDDLGWYDPDKQSERFKPCIPNAFCRNNYWVREDTIKI